MSNRIYPSLAMLPLEDMANYLNIVHGFRSKNDQAPDVEEVAGKKSSLIAIAAVDEKGELIDGRTTIDNALKLGGLDASKYLTIDNSKSLLVDAHTISRINADEIKNLRDELYQMKSELVKNGLVKDNYSYHGFQDPFRIGHVKYIDQPITRGATVETRATLSDITVVDASELLVGEYIVIEDAGKNFLTKIIKKEGNRLYVSPSVNGPLSSVAVIKRALGMYHNSSFLFGEEYGRIISDKEKHIILNDDYGDGESGGFALPRLSRPGSGFAIEFSVPRSVTGAISKLTVSVRGAGVPGALRCYIVDADITDGVDIYKMTLDEIMDSGKVVCVSDTISGHAVTTSFVDREFVFSTPEKLTNKRYVAFIHCLEGTDSDNYWELRGLRRNGGGDLHTNIHLYSIFNNSLNKHTKIEEDIYFAITTREVYENNVGYLKEGLYSTKVELPKGQEVSRVRVELKVNREGRFKVVNNPSSLVVKGGDMIHIENEDKKAYTGSIFTSEANENIVVGNQVAQVGTYRVSNTSFSLVDDTYAPPGAEVYRVGYNVIVTAKNKYIDYNSINDPVKYKDAIVVPLKLVSVIPGKEAGKENSSSDRLIFEAELSMLEDSDYRLKGFNDLLVQVAWTSPGVTQEEMYSNPELAGAIYDITISTDKAYNKETNTLVASFNEEA